MAGSGDTRTGNPESILRKRISGTKPDALRGQLLELPYHRDGWISFVDYADADPEKKEQQLLQKLERLKELIVQREECFGEDRCFL